MISFEEKKENFIKLVDKIASKMNKRFFIDSGEGHDLETDDLYCEDIFGWLIDEKLVDEFLKSERESERWDEFFVCEEWSQINDEIIIDFKKYPIYK